MKTTDEIKISEYDSTGNKTDYTVIMIYDSDVTNKRYIFYTDGIKGADDKVGVRVGFIEESNGNVKIKSITNPIEQEMLSEIYAENVRNNSIKTME